MPTEAAIITEGKVVSVLPGTMLWEPEGVRKLAGKRLNLDDETGGKSGPYARLEAAPQGQAIARG
jgi:hypothetical protein